MTQSPSPTLLACLGGLVHDLGKLWAQVPGRPPHSTQFNCERPREHRSFEQCPSCSRRYRWAHAPLGALLLQETLPAFPALQELAAMHHAAEDLGPVLRAVKLGDQLSAGERDERYDRPEAGAPTPLPVLQNPLAAPDAQVPIRPAPLSIEIPLADPPVDAATARQSYPALFDSLRAALAGAAEYAGIDYTYLADYLLGAVYRGAVAVPSAFQRAVADISLASHLHLAGAFAAALAHDNVAQLAPDRPAVGVVAGDLSGIQEFVHAVASKGAARSLRARSFYLQVLSMVVARFVARACDMPAPAVIANAGGNFLVVVPLSRLDRVVQARIDLERALVGTHGPHLGVALASAEISPAELGDFLRVRRSLAEMLSTQKNRRYAASAEALGLFEPRSVPSVGEACRACGRDAEAWKDEGDSRLCSFCASLEALGQRLPSERFLTVRDVPPHAADGWNQVFARLGLRVELREDPPPAPFPGATFALDDQALAELPCARFLPVGRAVPRYAQDEGDHRAGEALDFDAIASCNQGRPILAVAKVDVDDLGRVLEQQLTSSRVASPSRFAAFSMYLSLFFEGYLNARAASGGFPHIYMVYAGGDDLLCVGPLGEVLGFLGDARAAFARWTGHNPALHFSAGVGAGSAGRPVVEALAAAEQLLARSKELARPGQRKDALTILGWTGSWQEFKDVSTLSQQLLDWLASANGGDASVARSLLRRLQRLEELDPGDGTVRYGPAMWRAYYDLGRFAERNRALQADLQRIYREALEPGGGSRVALAARLAEIATATRDRSG